MRYYFNSLFRILFLAITVFVLQKSFYKISPGEAIIVRTGSGVISEVISKEGFHFVFGNLAPGTLQIDKIRIKNRIAKVLIKKELSGGLFPEMGDEGYMMLNLISSYSIQPEHLDEIISGADGKEENISQNISQTISHKFNNTLSIIYKDPQELPLLRNRILEYTDKNFLTDLNLEKQRGIIFENIKITKLEIPDPKVYLRLFAGTDIVIRARIERANASIRGEGNAIEQMKKDEAYFKRLEKTAQFLKNHPDLKEFALTDRLSDKVQVIAVPNDKYIGDIVKDKMKPKRTPKEIE